MMWEKIQHLNLSEIIPFVIGTAQRGAGNIQMNGQRVFEAILIAVLTAIGTGYTVTVRLEERVRIQMDQVAMLTNEIRDLRGQLGAARIQMGDRWTATQQRQHEKELYDRLDRLFYNHKTEGH